jgi:hypothetical protein
MVGDGSATTTPHGQCVGYTTRQHVDCDSTSRRPTAKACIYLCSMAIAPRPDSTVAVPCLSIFDDAVQKHIEMRQAFARTHCAARTASSTLAICRLPILRSAAIAGMYLA